MALLNVFYQKLLCEAAKACDIPYTSIPKQQEIIKKAISCLEPTQREFIEKLEPLHNADIPNAKVRKKNMHKICKLYHINKKKANITIQNIKVLLINNMTLLVFERY